jgi:hypothetical protein
MRRLIRVIVSLALGAIAALGGTTNALAVHLGCTAEINPHVIQAGTIDQALDLTVYNGPQTGGPSTGVLPANGVMVYIPPGGYVTKSASGPPPWQALILSPQRIWFHQGEIGLGKAETFTMVMDVPSTPATQLWKASASDDDGVTGRQCPAAYPGALDVTIIS